MGHFLSIKDICGQGITLTTGQYHLVVKAICDIYPVTLWFPLIRNVKVMYHTVLVVKAICDIYIPCNPVVSFDQKRQSDVSYSTVVLYIRNHGDSHLFTKKY